MHPNAADLYITKVHNLREVLNDEDRRTEVVQILRSLVDEIWLHLASVHTKQKPGFIGNPGGAKWLVAGACYNQDPTIIAYV